MGCMGAASLTGHSWHQSVLLEEEQDEVDTSAVEEERAGKFPLFNQGEFPRAGGGCGNPG